MPRERVIQQVHGILAMNGHKPRRNVHDESLLVEMPGRSSAVFVHFEESDGRTLIRLTAEVLAGIELNDSRRRDLLENLNQLNTTTPAAKFCLDGDVIHISHDVAGESLDEAELMTPLLSLGEIADELDDRLMESFGGRRAADIIARIQELAMPTGTE